MAGNKPFNPKDVNPVPRSIALSYSKMTLTAKRLPDAKMPPQLSWSMWGMNPRLNFNAGYASDSSVKNNYYTCKFDILTALSVCELITVLADSQNAEMGPYYVESLTPDRTEGAKPWELTDQSVLEIGKDAEGIYLRPSIKESEFSVKFYIVPTRFHKFKDKTKKDINAVMLAAVYAKTYAKTIATFITGESVDLTSRAVTKQKTRYDYREQNNNNGGGNSYPKNNSRSESGEPAGDDYNVDNDSDGGWS